MRSPTISSSNVTAISASCGETETRLWRGAGSSEDEESFIITGALTLPLSIRWSRFTRTSSPCTESTSVSGPLTTAWSGLTAIDETTLPSGASPVVSAVISTRRSTLRYISTSTSAGCQLRTRAKVGASKRTGRV